MMTDLIRRLRTNPMKNKILREAADELEKLEIMNTRLRAALQEIIDDYGTNNRSAAEIARRALEPKP